MDSLGVFGSEAEAKLVPSGVQKKLPGEMADLLAKNIGDSITS